MLICETFENYSPKSWQKEKKLFLDLVITLCVCVDLRGFRLINTGRLQTYAGGAVCDHSQTTVFVPTAQCINYTSLCSCSPFMQLGICNNDFSLLDCCQQAPLKSVTLWHLAFDPVTDFSQCVAHGARCCCLFLLRSNDHLKAPHVFMCKYKVRDLPRTRIVLPECSTSIARLVCLCVCVGVWASDSQTHPAAMGVLFNKCYCLLSSTLLFIMQWKMILSLREG